MDACCADIDECAQAGSCSQLCLNTPGSFKCLCMEGYEREPNEPSVCRAVGKHSVAYDNNASDNNAQL